MGRLSELAGKMDTAVERAEQQRAAVAKVKAELEKAEAAYAASVNEVRELHKQQQQIMQEVLSFGGTQHIAAGR